MKRSVLVTMTHDYKRDGPAVRLAQKRIPFSRRTDLGFRLNMVERFLAESPRRHRWP
jgi:hypothetical protein